MILVDQYLLGNRYRGTVWRVDQSASARNQVGACQKQCLDSSGHSVSSRFKGQTPFAPSPGPFRESDRR